jgi:hypothetical protein
MLDADARNRSISAEKHFFFFNFQLNIYPLLAEFLLKKIEVF